MPFDKRGIAFAAAGVTLVVTIIMKKEELRQCASSLCEWLSDEPEIASDVVRDAFTCTNVDPVPSVPDHTHATAAGLRTSATNFVSNMATYCGADVYVVGMSRSDQRKDMKGSRQWHWAKDVNTSNRNDAPEDRDIRYLCDVDYYIDMEKLLLDEAKPVVLYTVVPETATSSGVDDTSFHFLEDGSLSTNVSGGGHYQHRLWNYEGDSLLVVSRMLGVPTKAICYAVERKQVATHRQIVLLTPIRMFYGMAAVLASCLLDDKPLKRFNPIVVSPCGQSFVRFYVHKPKAKTVVTTARPGSWLSATVDAEDRKSVV